jgi:hypothetical protein
MVWIKNRGAIRDHCVFDTVRGQGKFIYPNLTDAQVTYPSTGGPQFGSSGFSFTSLFSDGLWNGNNETYASWSFREQAKFFDIVTYTGNGAAGQTINHNLGSVPGFMVVKRTNTTGDWAAYHRSLGATQIIFLNDTQAAGATVQAWNNTEPTSTQFTVGVGYNASGSTYVAYLFAHNAGGFGLTGTDNVISCGSYTGTGAAGNNVTLNYEPQWLLIKNVTNVTSWQMFDVMRGMPVLASGNTTRRLNPNNSNAEFGLDPVGCFPTSTGFTLNTANGDFNASGDTYIYIAIRRGPMAAPTTGTSVFSANTQTGANTTAGQTITTNFPVDLEISMGRNVAYGNTFIDRLRGGQNYLLSQNTDAEVNFTSWTPLIGFANNTGITDANYGSTLASYVAWNFRRAPGFFDEVCYTGNSTAGRQVTHNLGVVPELMIVKARNDGRDWMVYCSGLTANNFIKLNLSNAQSSSNYAFIFGNDTVGIPPTSSVFTVGTGTDVNNSSNTYVAYLFASCPGVSKVGSYTGTGATQVINCGFTGGARFVLIKRTDSTGDWYVWDTARGMVAGTDPYLLLNSAVGESNINLVYTTSVGFEIVSSASAVNASGGTYIFLAIA